MTNSRPGAASGADAVIGGRVLDTSALLAFATESSVYCAALVWTAVKESIVLARYSAYGHTGVEIEALP